MRKTLLFISLLIVFGVLSANAAFAGDSLSFSMSCTIPAIPGVNVPLIEEKTLKTGTDTPAQPEADSQKETQPQTPPLIELDTQEDRPNSEGQNSLVIVRTIYSR